MRSFWASQNWIFLLDGPVRIFFFQTFFPVRRVIVFSFHFSSLFSFTHVPTEMTTSFVQIDCNLHHKSWRNWLFQKVSVNNKLRSTCMLVCLLVYFYSPNFPHLFAASFLPEWRTLLSDRRKWIIHGNDRFFLLGVTLYSVARINNRIISLQHNAVFYSISQTCLSGLHLILFIVLWRCLSDDMSSTHTVT